MVATDKTQTPADVTSPVSYSLKGWKLCFRLRQIQRPGKIKGASWLADSGTSDPELVSPSLSLLRQIPSLMTSHAVGRAQAQWKRGSVRNVKKMTTEYS